MSTNNDKNFLTYNQQMRKLRDKKKIICNGSSHKRMLIRAGYFNLINGYKTPFISDIDENGNIPWYDTDAYSSHASLQEKMGTISKAYTELSRSHLDYVDFYKNNHSRIPTWIMLKVVNFSTFINVLAYSKTKVRHSLCELYGIIEIKKSKEFPHVKLLIGSLHWMRKVRNACAHNERIYCISRAKGRIFDTYLHQLRPSYTRNNTQKIFDLIVYFKYFLPATEYRDFVSELKSMIFALKGVIDPAAFDNIRGQMGIAQLEDLDTLVSLEKGDIEYNKFDKF